MISNYSVELVQIHIEEKNKVQNIPYVNTKVSPQKMRTHKSHL